MARLLPLLLLGMVLGACGGTPDADQAETIYGAPVDATTTFPALAVAAEDSLYVGHILTVGGRITEVGAGGCHLRLDTGDEPPLLVTAARTDDGSCAWQVPAETNGFAVAAGTLRASDDTLRLTANGVRVTPVRVSSPDS
ncbi:MAG: hypothetical protein ABEL04_14450 [Salinibacter sp.]|uniref:hypothetical protein n=1 Tax=Salinibacter sp. TaxID=2065818 RepID=UPI0035D4065B